MSTVTQCVMQRAFEEKLEGFENGIARTCNKQGLT